MNTAHERANDSTDTLKEAIAIDGWTDGPDGDDGTNSQTNSYYAADVAALLGTSQTRTFAFAFAIRTDIRQTNGQAHRHTNMIGRIGRQTANVNSQSGGSIIDS